MSDSLLDSTAQPFPCTTVSGGLVVRQEGLSEHVIFEQKLNDENQAYEDLGRVCSCLKAFIFALPSA